MNAVRRAMVAVAVNGTALAGVTVASAIAAMAAKAPAPITPPKAKGTYSYRVLKLAAHCYLAGTSNVVKITV